MIANPLNLADERYWRHRRAILAETAVASDARLSYETWRWLTPCAEEECAHA